MEVLVVLHVDLGLRGVIAVEVAPKIISPPQERQRFPLAKKTGLKTDLQTRWPQNMDFCTT